MRLPAPIRTATAHAAALTRIAGLMSATPGTRAGDELDLLTTLVEHYERSAFPMGVPGPVEAIEFRLEQSGLARKDLEPLIGSRGRVSEVMTGKRSLSIAMIRALHENLGIPLESLVPPAAARSKLRGTWRVKSAPRRAAIGRSSRRAKVKRPHDE